MIGSSCRWPAEMFEEHLDFNKIRSIFARMRLVTQFILDYVKVHLNIVEIVLTSPRVGLLVCRIVCARAVSCVRRLVRERARACAGCAPAGGSRGAKPPVYNTIQKIINCSLSWNGCTLTVERLRIVAPLIPYFYGKAKAL